MKIVFLKKGIHDDLGNEGNPEIRNKIRAICATIILLKAEKPEEKHILIDTGNLGYADEILEALEKQGIKPEEIEYILNTHGHSDHVSNNYLFKNAQIIIGTTVSFPDKSLISYNKIESIKTPGVKRIETPGHFEGHTSIVLESEGKTIIISGDAIQEEYIKTGKFGVPQNQDYIDSAKKIVDMADVIIPGHGRIIEGESLEELKQAVYKMEIK